MREQARIVILIHFDINIIKSNYFDMKNMKIDSEVLLLGVGSSNIIDSFIKNKFQYTTSVNFSAYLIQNLKEKYEGNKECEEYDCNIFNKKLFIVVCRNIIDMTKEEKNETG